MSTSMRAPSTPAMLHIRTLLASATLSSSPRSSHSIASKSGSMVTERLLHFSTRRCQKAVTGASTTITAASGTKSTSSKVTTKTTPLTRSAAAKKIVPVRQVTTLSSISLSISSLSVPDSTRAILPSFVSRAANLTGSNKPKTQTGSGGVATTEILLEGRGGSSRGTKTAIFNWPSFRLPSKSQKAGPSLSSRTQTQAQLAQGSLFGPMTFPPPKSTTSPGPESMPFLDFRTNDSREVYYTQNAEEANLWLESMESSETKMWALDAEWKPFDPLRKVQGRIALIQLGNNKTIYLLHIIHMAAFPTALARILRDKRVLKVGINIRNDGTKIMKDWGVGCVSLVELGVLSFQVQDDPTQRMIRSMVNLTKDLLGHDVEKEMATRSGDWQRKSLSSTQLAYAANDVFVTYMVAERIKQLQKSRPSLAKEYVLQLATIQTHGTKVVTVRGTLQEREDRPATLKDVVPESATTSAIRKLTTAATKPQTSKTKKTGKTVSTKSTSSSILKFVDTSSTAASKTVAKTAPSRAIKTTSSKVKLSLPKRPLKATATTPSKSCSKYSASLTSTTSSSATALPMKTVRLSSELRRLNGVSNLFYRNNAETKYAIEYGGRSVVTIIPAKQYQKRSLSSKAGRFPADARRASEVSLGSGDDVEDREDRRPGDVYIPSGLLPESLEGKDVLARNQAVWQEAGGRDLSGEAGTEDTTADNDWHLRQNQALFQSLMTGSEESGKPQKQ